MTPDADRVGVLIVRIWTEGAERSLRARITETLDVATRTETSHLASSVDQVLAEVRRWLETFLTNRP